MWCLIRPKLSKLRVKFPKIGTWSVNPVVQVTRDLPCKMCGTRELFPTFRENQYYFCDLSKRNDKFWTKRTDWRALSSSVAFFCVSRVYIFDSLIMHVIHEFFQNLCVKRDYYRSPLFATLIKSRERCNWEFFDLLLTVIRLAKPTLLGSTHSLKVIKRILSSIVCLTYV